MVAKKTSSKAKDFNNEAHYQSSRKVPLKAYKEYGTGLPAKKAKPSLAPKKKVPTR